jgi:hypothetical protein
VPVKGYEKSTDYPEKSSLEKASAIDIPKEGKG